MRLVPQEAVALWGSYPHLLLAGLGRVPWLAITLVTIVVRTLPFPLTEKQIGACDGFKN